MNDYSRNLFNRSLNGDSLCMVLLLLLTQLGLESSTRKIKMIFSIGNHVEQIKRGVKTQTRRASDRYQIGKTYAVQPGRTEKGIPEGRIMIVKKKAEICCLALSREDAKAEGGYTPEQFESLYEQIHPTWLQRWAYTFTFLPKLGDKRK